MSKNDHTRMSIDLTNEEHRKLKAIAALRGVSMKSIVREGLGSVLYSDNVPNEQTLKALRDAEEGKNITQYKDLGEFRAKLGL